MRRGTKLEFVSFDLTSPKDMLEKLRREINRIEAIADREESGDHVVNAFWTGWHLHEWVWDAIRERPAIKATVLAHCKMEPHTVVDQKAFGTELAKAFRPLDICRIIATSAKHVHVVLQPDSPKDVGTAFRAVGGFGGSMSGGMQDLSAIDQTPTRWVPMLVVEDKPVPARNLLEEIDAYWVGLIYGCEVERRT